MQAQQLGPVPKAGIMMKMDFAAGQGQQFEFVIADPLETEPLVKDAPFSAEAVNEFMQVLADGNRIERRFATSLWRDSQGRTRREQQIALVGPLSVPGEPPRMVTINDPVAGVSYTLDELSKTANRHGKSFKIGKLARTSEPDVIESNTEDVFVLHTGNDAPHVSWNASLAADQALGGAFFEAAAPAANVRTEALGTRFFDGVAAQGTRTTMTIPPGAVGNVAPIDVVSERWFSKELQTAVAITRNDPRSGETVYRLTNIVRSEPPPDLFKVPSDYRIVSPR